MNSQVANGSGSAAGMSREQTSSVIRILEGYLGRLEQGCPPDPDELLARHPELSDVLRIYLDKLALLHHAATGLRDPNQAEDVAPAALLPERGRLGDFRILREIGRGGMGVVYEAEQISLTRRVALKVLPFTTALDAKQLQRFKKEAQAAAQLHHTHIVPVYFVGVDRGVHYYAMQFIEGQTLAAMITEMRQLTGLRRAELTALAQNGSQVNGSKTLTRAIANQTMPRNGTTDGEAAPLQEQAEVTTKATATLITRRSTRSPVFFRTAARLGIQAAEALEHAHQMGVVHRDIKPANLLIGRDGQVKITDFGLASVTGGASLTTSGLVVGTGAYLAPERVAGECATAASDLYSLGVVGYQCLTGRLPFCGPPAEAALAHLRDPFPPLPDSVPAELRALVAALTAKKPADRPGSAGEVSRRARILRAAPAAGVGQLCGGWPPALSGSRPADQAPTLAETSHSALPDGRPPPIRTLAGAARHRMRWMLIAAGLAISAAIIAAGVARWKTPVTGATRPHTIVHPSPAASHPAPAIAVNPASLTGRPVGAVLAELRQRGLRPGLVWVPTSAKPPGTVLQVRPAGALPRGATVTVSAAAQPGDRHGGGHGRGNGGNNSADGT
jgi:serine/threonine protein kinase